MDLNDLKHVEICVKCNCLFYTEKEIILTSMCKCERCKGHVEE